MSVIEQYSGKVLPQILMGTGGTAGDLIYMSTGSGMTYKSASNGTSVTNAFVGVLADTTAAGSYAGVICDGVVQLAKIATANKIEAGDRICGTKSVNLVGTLIKGTAIGIAVKQSSTSNPYVSVKLLPYWITGAYGYHA